ncbi:hypothetical protein [Subtercola endophyticus]|uniref:hypothetical protein n=1 Tax=Subtercola endophyticus TaxID=2895559 RepID=UPI001E3CA77C|nr:hypothetical protein [Subtercola endophyticus]UFS60603.1 hypothetical protein LQ955_07645 [Subtercola endophyticus]
MLNGNPTLSDVDLPASVDEQVAFWTSHSEYALRNYRDDSWYLFRVERSIPRVTHFLHARGTEWVAAPVDAGRNVHAPDWRDALRRVVT